MNCTLTEARSLFLSDLHLGWRYSNGFQAAEILSQCSPEFLYLIGDTFEWLHHPRASSTASIENFLQVLGNLNEKGTRIFLLPGNHDEALAKNIACQDWLVVPSVIHECLSGTRFLIVHGDVFDLQRGCTIGFGNRLGRWIYPKLVGWGNTLARLGVYPNDEEKHWCTHWKMSSHRVKNHIQEFQGFMLDLADAHACDGVVCGHIHLPNATQTHKQLYFNCGDWIEHRSLAYECQHGELILVRDALNPLSSQKARCATDGIGLMRNKLAV